MAEPDGTENLPPAPLCSDETDRAVPPTFTRPAPQRRPAENMSKVPSSYSSMAQYREKMEPVEKAAVAPVEAEVIGPESTAAAIPEIPVAEEPAVEETKKVPAEPASVVQEEDAVEPADDLAAEAVKPVVVSAVAEATPEVKAPVEVMGAAPAVAVQTAPVEKAAVAPVEAEVIGPESTAAAIPLPVAEEPAVEEPFPAEPASAAVEEEAAVTVEPAGCIWWLVPMLLVLGSAALLAYKFPALHQHADGRERTSRSVALDGFAAHLSALEAQFPSQRAELWKRSRIHLGKHLQMDQPTEPVSLILTAGRKAEKTLHCLAGGLASAYSSALNASVLHIDGASKAHLDSDEVNLDIDNQLRGAFEGDKPVAVIHRFEELPPGSTLIFYHYCDHKTAAYKQVFLAFTVLLPQEEVQEQKSLPDVEEMVHDYIYERFVGTDKQTEFNEMDVNKFSGLWSCISHLILPVAAEDEVEQKGCQ